MKRIGLSSTLGNFRLVLFLFLVAGLSGCATTEKMSVVRNNFGLHIVNKGFSTRVYTDPDRDLASFKTYAFDYTDATNPLLEKELFTMLESVLRKKGLSRDDNNPQLLITMSYYTGRKENYTPPQTITTTRIEKVWDGVHIIGGETPVPIAESYTTPGYTTVKYYNNIRVNILDYSKLQNRNKPKLPPLVYVGEAECEVDSTDIRLVAYEMFLALMKESVCEVHLVLNLPQGGSTRFKCSPRGDVLEVTDTGPFGSYRSAEILGIQNGDIVKSIAGVPPIHFIETMKRLVPDPRTVRHATHFTTPFTSIVDAQIQLSDSYWFDVRPDTARFEIQSSAQGTTKRF